jgi:hypothetical protein
MIRSAAPPFHSNRPFASLCVLPNARIRLFPNTTDINKSESPTTTATWTAATKGRD